MLYSAQLEFRYLILEHEVPAVLSIDLYEKNCMSHSSKFMGSLIFSYMAFNNVKWNISFLAFYYRFFVAIKMLLKLMDVNTPVSPIPHLYNLALISGNCGVINTHEQGHVLCLQWRRETAGWFHGVSSLNTNRKCIQMQSKQAEHGFVPASGSHQLAAGAARVGSAWSQWKAHPPWAAGNCLRKCPLELIVVLHALQEIAREFS